MPNISEIFSQIRGKRKSKENELFNRVCVVGLTMLFPVSFFVMKKIVFSKKVF